MTYEEGLEKALQNNRGEDFEDAYEALSYENNGFGIDKTEAELVEEAFDMIGLN